MNKQKGISQIAVMVIMLILAIALPVATKLVQREQENRSKATGGLDYGQTCNSDDDCLSKYCTIKTTDTPIRVCAQQDGNEACAYFGGNCMEMSMTVPQGSSCKLRDELTTGTVAYGLCWSEASIGTKRCCVPPRQCQSGEQKCVEKGKYNLCGANYVWNTTSLSCPDGYTCEVEDNISANVCIKNDCINGQKKCGIDGITYQICTDGKWGTPTNCTNDSKCTSGYISQVGIEICKSENTCLPSCLSDGMTLQKCNTEGTGIGSTENCFVNSIDGTPNSGACDVVDGLAKCVRCNTGDKDCSSENFAGVCVGKYTCKVDRSGWDYTSCEFGCVAGVCGLCGNGNQRCVSGNKYETCSNGLWGSALTTCVNGSCIEGNIDKSVCVINQCVPNIDKQCLGTKLQICNSTGNGWIDVTECGTAGCNATTKACNICSPNTKQCFGTKSQTCNSSGTAWIDTECGTAGCNAITKECNSNTVTCTTGAYRCNKSDLEVCNEDSWKLVKTCAFGCLSNETTTDCVIQNCQEGLNECVNVNQTRTCTNNVWLTTNCNSLQYCLNGKCQDRAEVSANIKIKLVYAGVKANNDQCAVGWKTALKLVDNQGNKLLTGEKLTGVPQKTGQVNNRNEIIYELSTSVSKVMPTGGLSNLAFLLKGEKNMSMKYGVNNQSAFYNSLAGTLSLVEGENSYDFSRFPMFGGDVTGVTDGLPDGKIDILDWSYVKSRSDSPTIVQGAAGENVPGDVDGNCKVNAGDVRLVTDALEIIYDQLY